MEKIESKEFLEKLNTGNLKPESILFGKVKRSDKNSQVLFSFKGDGSNWTKIPGNMIEHVHLIKTFTCDDEKLALVKMHLKPPADKEAKVLYDLLAALQAKVMKWHMKKMMEEKGPDKWESGSEGRCENKWR